MTHSFFGGVYPATRKEMTRRKPLARLSVTPQEIVIPLIMCADGPATPMVRPGDPVLVGQPVARRGQTGAAAFASVSGRVAAIEDRPHPWGGYSPAIVIQNDDRSDHYEGRPTPLDPRQLTLEQLVERVEWAGIVGMGGATFPTHVKISSGLGKVDTVIVNASECEPCITSDHRVLLEHPDEVLGGVKLLARIFGVDRVHIAIEQNKANAAGMLKLKIEEEKAPAVVDVLPTRYPQGAEKQLCQSVTGRQVPPGALPAAIGCAVFNVVTTMAIYNAVYHGKPVTHRVVTVSGSGVNEPKNLLCPIGTPIADLLDACGGVKQETFKILMGGPMMGHAQFDMAAPIGKGTNAILAFAAKEERTVEYPACIRCGKCISVCPMHLQPVFLYQYEAAGMLPELEAAHVMDCIECGVCSYICPGRLHLVQAFRAGKQKLSNAKAAAKAAADAAKAAEEKDKEG